MAAVHRTEIMLARVPRLVDGASDLPVDHTFVRFLRHTRQALGVRCCLGMVKKRRVKAEPRTRRHGLTESAVRPTLSLCEELEARPCTDR